MKYELSFIISPAIPETEHQAVQQEIVGYLDSIKAKVTKEPYFIGRRKLTYPINKQKHGFYVFLEFASEENPDLKSLDNKLRLNSKLLRHLIVKLDRKAQEAKTDPSQFKEVLAPARPAVKRRPARRPLAKQTTAPTSPVKTSQERPKVSLDDIDKKLDELLKEPEID